jgi:hypothetical protein
VAVVLTNGDEAAVERLHLPLRMTFRNEDHDEKRHQQATQHVKSPALEMKVLLLDFASARISNGLLM